jgi:hypothetical protein
MKILGYVINGTGYRQQWYGVLSAMGQGIVCDTMGYSQRCYGVLSAMLQG